MALSPEQTARYAQIRAAVLADTATTEDLKEGIRILRGDRVAAQHASTASRAKKAASAVEVDPQAALAGLMALGKKLQSGPVA